MILDNFKCSKCGHIWTESKNSIKDEYSVTKCPNPDCGYELIDENDKTIFKKYGIGIIDVAEGYLGNGKTGYNNEDIYKPSQYSTSHNSKRTKLRESALNLPEHYYY